MSLRSSLSVRGNRDEENGDDDIERLSSNWYEGIVRIATIADGSCFIHALCKAILPLYQETSKRKDRLLIAYNFRRDIARKLLDPNPNYPTEKSAIDKLIEWQNIDTFRGVRDIILTTGVELALVKNIEDEEERKAADVQIIENVIGGPITGEKVLNYIKTKIEYPANILPFNSYYFTLNKGQLAITSLQFANQPDINDSTIKSLKSIFQMLINPSSFLGDGDGIPIVVEMLNINIIFFKVYGERVEPLSIIKPNDHCGKYILMNMIDQLHYETMGVIERDSQGSESVRTIFDSEHPFVMAAKSESVLLAENARKIFAQRERDRKEAIARKSASPSSEKSDSVDSSKDRY